MSVSCGVECVVILGCIRWAWKRCTYIGGDDSATWLTATHEEFEPIPRVCRLILAVYEPDLRCPKYSPAGGFRLNPDWVVKRVTYKDTHGHAPPYIIYLDHDNREIVLAIRGLNLRKESDYKLLMNNHLGMQMFDGGYVHYGLLQSAIWVLDNESETLKRLWEENAKEYKMVFAGHSLGSGVAALLTVIVVNHGDKLGGIPRSLVKCYAVAPARCMSLNLAVKYAGVISSVVLQDDFLPRTPTPLQDIFESVFCLPCLLFLVCLRDTFIPEGRKLRDPRRLYAPGRIYHIVERKFCRCGRYPPEVRSAIPVDGRFEHIVLSCNATSDHAIIWIEREAEHALEPYSVVMTWLVNSIDEDISSNYMCYDTAKELWDNINQMYSDLGNQSQVYELTLELGEICQDDCNHYKKIVEDNRIFKFLIGLNIEFDEEVTGRIIGKQPLQSIGEVFSEVHREESRRLIMLENAIEISLSEVLWKLVDIPALGLHDPCTNPDSCDISDFLEMLTKSLAMSIYKTRNSLKLKDHSTETAMAPPKVQKFDRKQTIGKEHKDALERAVSLNIPNAATTTGEESSGSIEGSSSGDMHIEPCEDETENSQETKTPSSKNARTNWNEVVEKLFKRDESGKLLLLGETSVSE